MKKFSLFGILLLGLISTGSYAQSAQQIAQSNPHIERMEREIGKLMQFQSDVQAIVLRRHIEQNWEGEAWVDAVRTTHDYDGDLETESLTEWWVEGAWVNSSRHLTSYEGNQVATTQFEMWDGTTWVPDSRTLYTYSGGTFSEILLQSYENDAWVNHLRTTITLSDGALASSQVDEWNGTEWVPSERYTIDQEGSDVVALSEEWIESAWTNLSRSVYPDITTAELFEMLQEFEFEAEEQIGFSLLLRFPDSVEQDWDGAQWVNESRQVTERDGEGRPVSVLMETWDGAAWQGETRYLATYNGEGRLASIEWQTFAEEWMPFVVETYTYDAAGLLESIVDQFNFGGGLQNGSRHLFEWIDTATSVEDDEMPSRIRLAAPYPNPFNPQSMVQYYLASPEHASLRVFDAVGRLVATLVDGLQSAGDHTAVFDASGLPSGVYMIRLETPSHVETRPVTLLR